MNDTRMQRGQQWLEEMLQLAGIPAAVKAELETDCYWLTIDETHLKPEQIQILIGSEGGAIDAIQYLANAILNIGQNPELQAAYTIELDGYRVRRQEELKAMAESAAQEAIQTGLKVELKSLSSAERRQVHTFLKEFADIETYSEGQEPDRRLVVVRRR